MIVGNVAEDRSGRGWRPGGPSLFSARLAHSLGWEVSLFTTLSDSFDRTALDDITLHSTPAPAVTRFANRHLPAGRRQLLLQRGTPISGADVARATRLSAEVFLLAPAFDEVRGPVNPTAAIVGAALQGVLRTATADGTIVPCDDPFGAARELATPGHHLFLSEEDAPAAAVLARRLAKADCTVFVTRGRAGASCFRAGYRRDFAALPSSEVDPTGAGDCFATALLLRLAETSDREEAIRYGLAAGALAVAAEGLAGVPVRADIERLLKRAAA